MSGLSPDWLQSSPQRTEQACICGCVCVMVVRTLSSLSCNCIYMWLCVFVMVVRTLSSLTCNFMYMWLCSCQSHYLFLCCKKRGGITEICRTPTQFL